MAVSMTVSAESENYAVAVTLGRETHRNMARSMEGTVAAMMVLRMD